MKPLLSFLLVLAAIHTTRAQLHGKVTSVAGDPIPLINVLLLAATDSALVKAAVTDTTGVYEITTRPGRYLLQISGAGYTTWYSSVELTTTTARKDIGVTVLQENKKQLAEVVVRARKPVFEQRPEGMVVNVESSVLTKGSTVLEVLERSPGIVIDHQNNSIALNGKQGVLVMLNGKMMRMPIEQVTNLLANMSANDVEKIELLTTPPAGYDAEGNAGIINIVLKKNRKQGTNGTVSATTGYGWGKKASAGINLSHNTKNVNLYGSYNFFHDHTYSNMVIYSSQNMPVYGGQLDVLVSGKTKATQNNHDVTAGVDYKITPRTTIGGNVNWNNSARRSTDLNHSDFTVHPDSLLFYNGQISGTNRWRNLVSSFYIETNKSEGEKWSASLDYLRFTNNNPTTVQTTFVNKEDVPVGNNDSMFANAQRGAAHTVIQVGVLKADYTKTLHANWQLQTGIKTSYTNNVSESGIESWLNGNWVMRANTSNNMVMKEGIGAGYVSVTGKLNATTNLVAGVRYEQAFTNMDDAITGKAVVRRRMGMLFPNLQLSKKIGDNSELQFSYSKRISRPSYTDLASFIRYSDPTAVYSGNPLLRPTVTHNIKLGYVYKGYSLSALVSRDIDPIARYQITESTDKTLLYVSPQNLGWQNNLTFQTSLPFTIGNWLTMSYGWEGGWRQYRAEHTLVPMTATYFTWSGNFSEQFKLPKYFTAELSGWYHSTFYNGTIEVAPMGAINAGIKKELNNNGGTLQLAATDLFRTMQINVYYGTVTKEAFGITNHVSINLESRVATIFKLSYVKTIGGAAQKRAAHSGATEESDRIQKN